MTILTLEDAKDHMRVTIDDDDTLIEAKISAAETWIGQYLGAPLASYLAGTGESAALPDPLLEATRQLVGFFYDNREAAVVGNTITVTAMTPGFYDLLAPYRCYVF